MPQVHIDATVPLSGGERQRSRRAATAEMTHRYYRLSKIDKGGYGRIYEAVDLEHPSLPVSTREALRTNQEVTLSCIPREARVAVKLLSDPHPKYVLREVSILQRAKEAHEMYLECLKADPHGLGADALEGSRYCLHLLDFESRESGYPTNYTEQCDTTLYGFAEMFHARRAPLCCVQTFFGQLLQAVDFMHNSMQAMHRDLKPANILLTVVTDELPPASDLTSHPRTPTDSASNLSMPGRTGSSLTAEFQSTTAIDSLSVLPPAAARTTTPPTSISTTQPSTALRPAGGAQGPLAAPATPATERHRPRPDQAGSAAAHRCCPFCGSALNDGDANPLNLFRGLVRDSTRDRRMRQVCAQPSTIEQSFLHRLFTVNGVEFNDARRVWESTGTTPLGVPTRRARLEVRLCDFGSACFLPPQPIVSGHTVAASRDDESVRVYIPGAYPNCGLVESVDRGATPHVMALTATLWPDKENTVTYEPEPVDELLPLYRPSVTHGWSTLQYRAPEDLLGAVGETLTPEGDRLVRCRGLARLGPSVDLWALGAILAELLTGEILFLEFTSTKLSGTEQTSPWSQLVAIFKVMGTPESGEQRRHCNCDNDAERSCCSPQCWPGVSRVVSFGSFLQQAPSAPQLVDAALAIGSIRHQQGLEAMPCLAPQLHAVHHGHLARRCVEMDMLRIDRCGERGLPPRAPEFAEIVDHVAAGISPQCSETYDLLCRLLLLDPARRLTVAEALDASLVTVGRHLLSEPSRVAYPPRDECVGGVSGGHRPLVLDWDDQSPTKPAHY
jgi:serine/threonine protein kinase